MPISIACPACGARAKAPDQLAGKKAKCPKCREEVLIPGSPAKPIHEKVSGIPLMPLNSAVPPPVPATPVLLDELEEIEDHDDGGHRGKRHRHHDDGREDPQRRREPMRGLHLALIGGGISVAFGAVVLVMAVLLCAGAGGGLKGLAAKSLSDPVAEMTAPELLDAYKSALSADRLYTGKPIILHGVAMSTERTRRGPLVRVHDLWGNVIDCYFRSEDQAASARIGMRISIAGICNGVNSIRTVDMVDCEVVEDIKKYRNVPPDLAGRFDNMTPVLKLIEERSM